MGVHSRHLLVMVVLGVWVLSGPIAMAFSGCAGMGTLCTGPCTLTAGVVPTPASLASPLPAAYWQIQPLDQHPTLNLKVPDPPPKSVSIPA